jgi:hypothetical protein
MSKGTLVIILICIGVVLFVYQKKDEWKATYNTKTITENGVTYKLYNNKQFGYEIKHSQDLEVSSIENGYSWSYPNSQFVFAVEVILNQEKKSLDQHFSEQIKEVTETYLQKPNSNMTLTTSRVNVNGHEGRKFVINNFGNLGNAHVFVYKDSLFYELIATETYEVSNEGHINTLVHNFKFTK